MSDDREDVAAAVENGARASRSLIDKVKARNAQGLKPLYLPIPRWNGDIVVEFKKVPPKVLAATAGTSSKTARAANADLIVEACKEIYIVDPETGNRARLGENGPVRFDGTLAELFDLGDGHPRDFVLRMYADDTPIGRHAQRVIDWQTGENLETLTPEEIDERLGEEDAAT